jgi:hypothetical protein
MNKKGAASALFILSLFSTAAAEQNRRFGKRDKYQGATLVGP